jgi:CheY-like chemotaxis protein
MFSWRNVTMRKRSPLASTVPTSADERARHGQLARNQWLADNDRPFPGQILVVEDDPRLRDIISSFLIDEGYGVRTARTGVEALESIELDPPALILLDMYLPVMNGWELTRELRARGISIPIVVMTGASEARRWAVEVGAAAYVAKPLSLPSLIRRLDDIGAP